MKRWYIIVILALVVVFSFIYFSQKQTGLVVDTEMFVSKSYMDIGIYEAKMLMEDNSGLIIIDVSPNYAAGHLPGAVNYYVGDGSFDVAIPMLDPSARYLVYCHVDSASRAGAQKLIDAGFMNVYRLRDHYSGWVEAGYAVEY